MNNKSKQLISEKVFSPEKNHLKLNNGIRILLMSTCCVSSLGYAGISFGDKEADTGKLSFNGTVRAKYIYDFDREPSRSELSFADAVLWVNYESPKWLAKIDYRIYDYYGRLGTPNWLTDAWVGYKINPESKLIAGLNPVPFGLGQFWGSTYYLGIANAAGLEDVHNLGLKYDFNNGTDEFQLAYYPTDGGNYSGQSKDSRRYTVNFVNADDYVEEGTNTQEKNAVVARFAHQFKNIAGDENLASKVGASAWYSQVENKRSNTTGDRKVWSVFANTTYKQWTLQTLAGYQDIDNADLEFKDHITLGGFDGSFNSATKGQVYSAELAYAYANNIGPLSSVKPYVNYSAYVKDKAGYKHSQRIISGVAFNYQKISVQAELLLGKHDPYIDESLGLAQGGADNSWHKRLFIALGYYF